MVPAVVVVRTVAEVRGTLVPLNLDVPEGLGVTVGVLDLATHRDATHSPLIQSKSDRHVKPSGHLRVQGNPQLYWGLAQGGSCSAGMGVLAQQDCWVGWKH